LHSRLDFFPENLGEVSDEQVERFYQNIKSIEHRYQGFWNGCVMTEYCWRLYRDALDIVHHRKRNSPHF